MTCAFIWVFRPHSASLSTAAIITDRQPTGMRHGTRNTITKNVMWSIGAGTPTSITGGTMAAMIAAGPSMIGGTTGIAVGDAAIIAVRDGLDPAERIKLS